MMAPLIPVDNQGNNQWKTRGKLVVNTRKASK